MRKIAMTVALAVAAPMPAQAKTLYVLQPQPAAGQHEEWDNGDHAVVDAGAETVVMIVQARDELPGNSSAFRVYVANNSSAPFNLVQKMWPWNCRMVPVSGCRLSTTCSNG